MRSRRWKDNDGNKWNSEQDQEDKKTIETTMMVEGTQGLSTFHEMKKEEQSKAKKFSVRDGR